MACSNQSRQNGTLWPTAALSASTSGKMAAARSVRRSISPENMRAAVASGWSRSPSITCTQESQRLR
ncbi:hypothetical protein D3C86_1940020 [compost metagenome]